jgi:hypothetical protein
MPFNMAAHEPNAERQGAAAWHAIEPYWKVVSIYDGSITFLEGFERLPEPVRHLYAARWCDQEVCNGGFRQFFSNSTGVLAPEAIEGYRKIGLTECADLVEAAVGKFGELYPRDRAARQAALRALELPGEKRGQGDAFDELDNRYYETKGRSRFYDRLDEFARQHAR